MELFTVGVLGVLLMLGLTVIGVPVAFALAVIGALGNVYLAGLSQTFVQVGLLLWEDGTNFLFIAIPLFIFIGQLVYHTGIATDLYDAMHKWFGRLPGGLAVTSTVAAAGFGAITGTSLAAVATMGSIGLPEMRKHGYDMRLATGSISAAGTLAILIPPSIILVLYGIWTETSIGALFIAGIIPGILMTLFFSTVIIGGCVLNPKVGPRGPSYPMHERLRTLGKLTPTVLIFLIVLGGIYGGVFTPNEAAGIGAAGVALVALVMRRLTWKALKKALHEAGQLGAILFAIILGGGLFNRFLIQTEVTSSLVGFIGGLPVNRYVIMILMMLMYLLLGAVLDVFGMIILTLPFVIPIVVSLGFDKVWFGIFITIMTELTADQPVQGMIKF